VCEQMMYTLSNCCDSINIYSAISQETFHVVVKYATRNRLKMCLEVLCVIENLTDFPAEKEY